MLIVINNTTGTLYYNNKQHKHPKYIKKIEASKNKAKTKEVNIVYV